MPFIHLPQSPQIAFFELTVVFYHWVFSPLKAPVSTFYVIVAFLNRYNLVCETSLSLCKGSAIGSDPCVPDGDQTSPGTEVREVLVLHPVK